jgi:hypothetical protein
MPEVQLVLSPETLYLLFHTVKFAVFNLVFLVLLRCL